LFDEANVELGRNFCNKLWNAARFRQMQGPTDGNGSLEGIVGRIEPALMDADDHAILGRLYETLEGLATDFRNYEFSKATQSLYAFFWGDYCDWYLEAAKTRVADEKAKSHILAVQDLCLREFLLLMHPFMPFITEELWQALGYGAKDTFIQNVNPGGPDHLRRSIEQRGINLSLSEAKFLPARREFASQARALKAQRNLGAKRDVKFYLQGDILKHAEFEKHREKLLRIVGASDIALIGHTQAAPAGTVATVTTFGTLHLDLAGTLDKKAEQARLNSEVEKLDKAIASSEAKLANEAFVSKAPAKVIEGARAQLAENVAKREELKRLLAALGA